MRSGGQPAICSKLPAARTRNVGAAPRLWRLTGEAAEIDDGAGPVGRFVVDADDFEMGIVLRQDAFEALGHGGLDVIEWDDD